MRLLLIISLLFLVGCTTKTKYIERQSEELSQAVYATKDSLDSARLDLANKYVQESVKIVAPPKNRIKIQSVIKSNKDGSTQRVLIVNTKNNKDRIVSVDSPEYQELIKDSRIADQLKSDVNNWEVYSKEVEKKLTEEYEVKNEMVVRIQDLEKQVLERDKQILKKDVAIIWRNIIVVSLVGTIGLGVYLRIKGVL